MCTWVLTLTYSSTAYVRTDCLQGQTARVDARGLRTDWKSGGVGGEVRDVAGGDAPRSNTHSVRPGVFCTVLEPRLTPVIARRLGFSAGPLLFGPSSELYGRQAVYRFCGVFYSIFSIAAAFAPNAPALLIFRYVSASPLLLVPSHRLTRASQVLHWLLWERQYQQRPGVDWRFHDAHQSSCVLRSLFVPPSSPSSQKTDIRRADATMAFGGPALGPLCSSFIETTVGFRWNLRVMAIFNTVVSIAVAFIPESHGPTLLKWRIASEGNAPPPLAFSKIVGVYKTALSRPIIYLFTGESHASLSLMDTTRY